MNNNKIKKPTKRERKQQNRKKGLLFSCAVLSSCFVLSSVASASDIEVYQPAVGNKKRIMLMVDQSRSMGGAGLLGLVKDYPICVGSGTTDILGDLSQLGLGIKLLGKSDLAEITKEAADLANDIALKGLLGDGKGGGILDSVAEIKTDQPSIEYPFKRHGCTVVTTPLVIENLDKLLNGVLGVGTGLSAEQYIRETCDPMIDISLLKPITGSSTVGVYRCYDKNSRVRMALTDILKGNDGDASKGLPAIEQLPDTAMVGLSVSPYNHTANDRAGAIVFEPKPLDQEYLNAAGVKKTHRQHIIDYIASPAMDSKGEFNISTLVTQVIPKLVTGLVTDVVNALVGTVKGVLGGDLGAALNQLLEMHNTNNAINDVLVMLGLGGNSPLASTYAETGAYLQGNTTKGTAARQMYRIESLGSALGILDLFETHYECLAWAVDGKCTQWDKKYWQLLGLLGLKIGFGDKVNSKANQLKKVNINLVNALGLAQVGHSEFYYEYHPSVDAKYSGFRDSASNSTTTNTLVKNADFYQAPSTAPQCDANGLMVITGSVPSIAPTLSDALLAPLSTTDSTQASIERLMGRSLSNTAPLAIQYKDGGNAARKEWNFQCNSTDLVSTRKGNSDFATWQCIGAYARDIRALQKNPIKTAVVGLDRSFLQLPSYIAGQSSATDTVGLTQINSTAVSKDQLLTGIVPKVLRDTLGNVGGLLDIALKDSIIGSALTNSVVNLLDQLLPPSSDDIKNMARWGVIGGGGWYNAANSHNIAQSIKNFHDGLGVEAGDPIGLQALPSDPLTPYRMSNEVYKSMFEPTEKASWFGNFKKYGLETNNSINKLKDSWDAAAKEYDVKDWNKGGLLKQLQDLPTKTNDDDPENPAVTERSLFTNRGCVSTASASEFTEVGQLKKINNKYLDEVCGTGPTAKKDGNGHFLMNLLGYNVSNDAITDDLTEENRTNWRVGMNLHSIPIKLTQDAVFNADNSIKERNDYMLFGTTQGVLHVVKANTGEETFAFIPNEMLENPKQQDAFTTPVTGHIRFPDNMAYGIDGAWTLDSEYVYGMKEVSSGSTSSEVIATVSEITKDGKVLAKGKQIVYGGLRMGGRSYYSLDLSNINQPKLKFRIDPISGKVYSKDNPEGKSFDAIKNMGQSWSKPTITTVMYKSTPRRVMLVGGGYNKGYENRDYNPQNNTEGAGVYMFDADNGDLLWHASGDNQSTSCGTSDTKRGLKIQNLGSVVSRINTVDRNGDGIADHLYFGDLKGQVWRIDLSNDLGISGCGHYSMLLQVAGERFYEAPNFSVYGYEQPLAVISIASGNRSLPFSDKVSTSRIYNIFDREVVGGHFDTSNIGETKLTLVDLKPMPTDLKGKTLTDVRKDIPNGWYISAETVIGKQLDPNGNETTITNTTASKVLGEMVVMNKSLYASVYNPNATTDSCKVQAQGITTVQRYCLPFGVCEQETDPATMRFGAGRGIVDVMVGAGVGTSENGVKRQILNPGLTSTINKANGMPINTMRRQIVPLKWYESNE
ncbi:pilus assembly protein [Acinetobacter haemolyticus]|uniref:pilus assembly protein n=1 Tax=Acinetobacter haemolyticus TaxID=29430 RepID=UPI000D68CB97|nr:PilC/PilY family type IV pilus protein [Acinetobacter haemolyticus]